MLLWCSWDLCTLEFQPEKTCLPNPKRTLKDWIHQIYHEKSFEDHLKVIKDHGTVYTVLFTYLVLFYNWLHRNFANFTHCNLPSQRRSHDLLGNSGIQVPWNERQISMVMATWQGAGAWICDLFFSICCIRFSRCCIWKLYVYIFIYVYVMYMKIYLEDIFPENPSLSELQLISGVKDGGRDLQGCFRSASHRDM